ncbi:MAG: hypothetical protein ACQEV7_15600 [Bacillota bacterium]
MSLYFEWSKEGKNSSNDQRYYFVQAKEPMDITLDSILEILKLDVKITSTMQRVWLDSKVNLLIETGTTSEYSIHTEFFLWRNNKLLTTESIALINQIGQDGKKKTLMNSISLSWTDVLLTPGNYTYTLKARRLENIEENISTIQLKDRALNVVVFPQ